MVLMSERLEPTVISDPEISNELHPAETAFITRAEKQSKYRNIKTISGYVLSLTVVTGINGYAVDIHENMALASESQVTIETIQEGDNESSLLSIGGYGSNNANTLADKVGPAIQQIETSSLESIRIGETAPSPKEIAEKAIAFAESTGKKEISLLGHSLGGIEAIRAAVEIIQEAGIRVKVIYLAATPSNMNTLRPERVQQLNALATVLSYVPYGEHSKYVKGLLSLASLKDNYMPGDDLFESLNSFNSEAFFNNLDLAGNIAESKDSPSVSVIEYQLSLARTDIRQDIKKLAEASQDQPMPTIVYLKTTDDTVVDTEKASKEICEAARENDIPCIIIPVETEHDRFYTKSAVSAYTEALADSQGRIRSSISTQEIIYSMEHRRQSDETFTLDSFAAESEDSED